MSDLAGGAVRYLLVHRDRLEVEFLRAVMVRDALEARDGFFFLFALRRKDPRAYSRSSDHLVHDLLSDDIP